MAYDLTDFQTQVIERSHEVPVLVDFWATWCGPCLMLAPILERLAGEADGKWDLVKIDTELHADLKDEFGVSGIPDVRLFRNGKEVDRFMGQLPEEDILKFINKQLDGVADQMEKARELLGSGDAKGAEQLLEAIEDKDDEVWILIAATRLETNPAGVAEAIDGIPLGSEFVDRGNALGKLAELVLNVDEWPEDGRPALSLAQKRDWAPALEQLIGLIEKERNYANGGAVEACKSIFLFLGLRHEIADKYHRLFSSMMFS
ncbi:MAG: tetratricopeptide repeat protein [Verrucomicrobiota bacterium]